MGNFKDSRVLTLLLDQIDGDSGVYAVRGLGLLGNPAALPALREAAESDDESLAKAANAAIVAIEGKPVVSSPPVRR